MHWGAWCLRYKPEDFNLFSQTGEGADWPINYEDLSPDPSQQGCAPDYYFEAEKYLSVCGDPQESWNQAIRGECPYPRPPFDWTAADGVMIKAFKNCGIEPGKMPIARYRKCMTTGTCKYCPFGSRFNAQYILDELKESLRYPHFEQRSHAPVMKIIAGDNERIEAIEYIEAREAG